MECLDISVEGPSFKLFAAEGFSSRFCAPSVAFVLDFLDLELLELSDFSKPTSVREHQAMTFFCFIFQGSFWEGRVLFRRSERVLPSFLLGLCFGGLGR